MPYLYTINKATNVMKMQRRTDLFLSRLGPLLRTILSAYIPNECVWINHSVSYFEKEIRRLVSERGITFTVKYVKTSRNAWMRYLSGQPLLVCDGVSLNSKGIPNWLVPISPDVNQVDRIRVLTTLLTSLRSITLERKLDLDTITDPFIGTDNITDKEIFLVMKALRIKPQALRDWDQFHMSTKRGPQGQAILSALSEVTLLPQQLIDNIVLLGGRKLANHLIELTDRLDILRFSSISELWKSNYKLKSDTLRKISYFSDKEGKTRVIGIMDYWSQSCLIQLHKQLNKLLRSIKNDCTF